MDVAGGADRIQEISHGRRRINETRGPCGPLVVPQSSYGISLRRGLGQRVDRAGQGVHLGSVLRRIGILVQLTRELAQRFLTGSAVGLLRGGETRTRGG